MKVTVLGGAGYAAGELVRLLLGHPDVRRVRVVSRSSAGQKLAKVHPALACMTDDAFVALEPAEAATGEDAVFLALEHGASSKLMPELLGAMTGYVLDLAADFRIQDAALRERHYGAHPSAELVPRFTYALCDILGPTLRGKRALAIPGCFATAAALASYVASRAKPTQQPVLFGITGSSGAGAQAKPTTHHPRRATNVQAYSLDGHRHEGELHEQWRTWTGSLGHAPRLLTHLGPFVRGISLTLHAHLEAEVDATTLATEAFLGRPFVNVVNEPPAVNHVSGTNLALLHATTRGRELIVSVAIDNLVKGAAGQAVQALNLAMGVSETRGLRLGGSYPA